MNNICWSFTLRQIFLVLIYYTNRFIIIDDGLQKCCQVLLPLASHGCHRLGSFTSYKTQWGWYHVKFQNFHQVALPRTGRVSWNDKVGRQVKVYVFSNRNIGQHLSRSRDATMAEAWEGLMPRDNPRDTRFAINFFTSIGLGALTEDLRAHLKNAPKPTAIVTPMVRGNYYQKNLWQNFWNIFLLIADMM